MEANEKRKSEIDLLCESFVKSRSEIEEKFKSLIEDLLDKSWMNFYSFLEDDSAYCIDRWIRERADSIVQGILNGETKWLKDQKIISEYTWDRIHLIRMAVLESCGDDITKKLINDLKETIDDQKKEIQQLRNYR